MITGNCPAAPPQEAVRVHEIMAFCHSVHTPHSQRACPRPVLPVLPGSCQCFLPGMLPVSWRCPSHRRGHLSPLPSPGLKVGRASRWPLDHSGRHLVDICCLDHPPTTLHPVLGQQELASCGVCHLHWDRFVPAVSVTCVVSVSRACQQLGEPAFGNPACLALPGVLPTHA